MPLGIVSDEEFDEEVGRIGEGRIERNETIPSDSISDLPSDSSPSEDSSSESFPSTRAVARIIQIPRGRGEGITETPEGLRKIISEDSLNGVPAKELSRIYDISPASIAAYKNGATSTASYHKKDDSLERNNSLVKSRLADRATRKIMLALRQITPDKIEAAKLRDISSLAKDMSAVVKNLESNDRNSNSITNNGPTYIFYAPRVRKEQEYEVIEVTED